MLGLSHILEKSQKFVGENSTTILTGVGVVGTIGTAVLTGRASFKARDLIFMNEHEMTVVPGQSFAVGEVQSKEISTKEKIKLVWPMYITPAACGGVTITSIIMANRISSKQIATMAAMYGLSEKRFQDYREKVLEKFGENKDRAIRDDIAQDRVNNTVGSEVIITTDGKVLCMDLYTGRYFESSKEDIKKAENLVNEQIITAMYCGLNEFYGEIGLEPTSFSDELGWNMHTTGLLEIQFSSTLTSDGRPCLAIDFANAPLPDYSRTY